MELFSEEWMKKFMTEWNNETSLANELAKINFNSTIVYGFESEEKPRGVIQVKNGHVTKAGVYHGEENNWDLRAEEDTWKNWMKKEMGMMGIGAAYTTRKLKFANGDYKTMIKNPRMAAPFIKSFAVMGRV
ncbi:MAG: SCP-2 sterol transfer family protein [gamma proteobacterium symbiont of Lucinoma myriamae]|nr:SCP-2 sterol transfer family protein [gamma proteobacterium symbiont of Lucinoma myriamae]